MGTGPLSTGPGETLRWMGPLSLFHTCQLPYHSGVELDCVYVCSLVFSERLGITTTSVVCIVFEKNWDDNVNRQHELSS